MALPDVPDTSYAEYQARNFKAAVQPQIDHLTQPHPAPIEAIRQSVAPDFRGYVDQAVAVAQKYGIDPLIYVKQIRQESGFNPRAGSNEGAKGIAQFTTPTAQGYGIDPWNASQSLDAGARYMASNLKANNGDYRLALASYNAGQGNVNKHGQNIFNPSYLLGQGWSNQDANQPASYIRSILGGDTPTPYTSGPTAAVSPPSGATGLSPGLSSSSRPGTSQSFADFASGLMGKLGGDVSQAVQPVQSFADYASGIIDGLGRGRDSHQSSGEATVSGSVPGDVGSAGDSRSTLPSDPGMFPNNDATGSTIPPGPPQTFSDYASQKIAALAPTPYNDMAGANSGPADTGLSSTFGQPQGIQAGAPDIAQADPMPSMGPGLVTAAQGASSLARGELAREAQTPGVGGWASQGLLAATDAYGGAAQANLHNPAYIPYADQSTTPYGQPREPLDKQGFTAAQNAAQFADVSNTVIGSAQPGEIVGGKLGTVAESVAPAARQSLTGALDAAKAGWTKMASLADSVGVDIAAHKHFLPEEIGSLASVPGTAEHARDLIGLHNSYTASAANEIRPAIGQRIYELQQELSGQAEAIPGDLTSFAKAFMQPNGYMKDRITLKQWQRVSGDSRIIQPNALFKEGGTVYIRPDKVMDVVMEGGEALARFGKSFDHFNDFESALAQEAKRISGAKDQVAELKQLTAVDKQLQVVQSGALPDSATMGDMPTERPPVGPPLAGRQSTLDAMPATAAANARTPVTDPLGAIREMYAKPPVTAAALSPRELMRRTGDTFTRLMTDRGVDLAHFQQDTAKLIGRPLQVDEMASELSRLNGDLSAKVKVQEGLQPTLQAMEADGLRSNLSEYLTVKHNIDIAKAIGERAGEDVGAARKFSGGINAEESRQALAQLEQSLGPERFAKVEAAAGQVQTFVNSIREQAVSSGLWNPKLAEDLKRQYPNYVPTKILDYMQEPGAIGNGTSLSVRDQGLKRLTDEGTSRAREDPLASLVRTQYQMEGLAGKNRAFNAFVKLNELRPEAERIIREVPDSYTATNAQMKVTGFIDGRRVIYVMPKEYATVIRQEGNAPIKGLTPALAFYRSLLTSKNPAFIAGQVPLDAISYIARETVRGGGPQALPEVITQLFKSYGDAWKGFGSQTFHGDTARFLKGGGGMGGFFQGEPGSVKATVDDLARANSLTINSADDVRRIVKDILTFKPIEAIGERNELAPRVASMRLAEKRGENAVTSVINGRTVTMDFAQGGTLSKFINQLIPFFNVGMQGMATPTRIVRDNPKAAFTSFLTLLAAPTIGAEAWNNADPQRAKDYNDIPNYIKNRSIVLMLPVPASVDVQGTRHPQYFEIRMREFSPFVDLTRQTMQTVLGTNTQSWASMIGGALNAASPVQTDSALGLFGSLVPPGISTGLDLANNRDSYRGATIATAGADARASALSTAGAGAIYSATGINARPSQVEFGIGDLGGGVGQIARDVSNIATGKPSQGTPQGTPLLGQLTRRFVGGGVGQRLQTAQDQRMSPAVQGILRDAGIYDVTPVSSNIGKIPLSRDEQAIFQQTTNDIVDALLPEIAGDKGYQSLTATQKATVMHNAMDKARAFAAKAALKQVDPVALEDRLTRQMAAP